MAALPAAAKQAMDGRRPRHAARSISSDEGTAVLGGIHGYRCSPAYSAADF